MLGVCVWQAFDWHSTVQRFISFREGMKADCLHVITSSTPRDQGDIVWLAKDGDRLNVTRLSCRKRASHYGDV